MAIYWGALLIVGGLALLLLSGDKPANRTSKPARYDPDGGPLVVYLPCVQEQPQSTALTCGVTAWSTSDMDEWRNFEAYKRAVKAGRVIYHQHIYSGSVTVHHEHALEVGIDGFEKDFGSPPKLPHGIKVGPKNQLLLEDKGGF